MPHPDGCPTIHELHARYDGPIPKDLRAAALEAMWGPNDLMISAGRHHREEIKIYNAMTKAALEEK